MTFSFPEALHPYFPSIVENVTVSHGRKAVLKCEVDNLRNYKVSSVNCCIGINIYETFILQNEKAVFKLRRPEIVQQ